MAFLWGVVNTDNNTLDILVQVEREELLRKSGLLA